MERLRAFEVRQIYRLLSECLELGDDWMAWYTHMAHALSGMLGANVFVGGEAEWHTAGQRVLGAVATGFESGRYWVEHKHESPRTDILFPKLSAIDPRLTTRTRRQLVDDQVWYSSCAQNYYRAVGLDDALISVLPLNGDGGINIITVHRNFGERDFSARERLQLHVFHRELGSLLRRHMLFRAEKPSASGLSPRLRQTLDCLLEGDSEKQVAARLSLSETTIHQYVGALYQHFRVNSRASLLAYFMRRARREDCVVAKAVLANDAVSPMHSVNNNLGGTGRGLATDER